MIYGPAIGVLEISSISRGYFTLDKLVKKAASRILEASSVSPGKFLILINGEVADVEESMNEALLIAHPYVLDSVHIPDIHPEVLPAIYAQNQFPVEESLGIVEVTTVSSGVLAADRACKESNVHLIDFRMARGIGGKSYFFITGSLDNVESGTETAQETLFEKATLVRTDIIARPHEDFLKYFNIDGDV